MQEIAGLPVPLFAGEQHLWGSAELSVEQDLA